MSIVRQLTRGLRALFRQRDADRDVNDEIGHYLEQATAGHVARGLTPEQAARAAKLEMGNTTAVREQVRTAGWEHLLETTLGDVRYALRTLPATAALRWS